MHRIHSARKSGKEMSPEVLGGIVAEDGRYIISGKARYRVKQEWECLLTPGDRVRFVPRPRRHNGELCALVLKGINDIDLILK